ncbi:hypothetical protein CPB83DRAFT_898597 [Crepidotus variabilis]|uniref:Uncharacterized protein n=1 Tax=Crepidotus variabilis TaxID=179855 RepID=A0A9P6JJW0_9AGAR|nr:hypothetical protein CPB83DRAFT_898597 [Crepidotus variabilis]
MSAAARAEARRKAILSRGTDRLAKLTTSARGEDAGAYLQTESPSIASNTSSFLGEESSNMPTPQRFTPSPSPGLTPRKQPSGNGLRATSGPASFVSASSPSASTTSSDHLFSPGTSASTAATGTPHNPSAFLPEQQQQFMQALMHAAASTGSTGASLPGLSSPIGDPALPMDFNGPPLDNPFAALLGAGGRMPQGGAGTRSASAGFGPPGFGQPSSGSAPPLPPGLAQLLGGGADPSQGFMQQEPKKPKTMLQKIMPLLHLVAIWCLLSYFILFAEPQAFGKSIHAPGVGMDSIRYAWNRWSQLAWRPYDRVLAMPFFSVYVTLQLVLHSAHYFLGLDAIALPSLFQLALPSLPPPFPSLIVNSLKYIKMGSMFLDDLSGLLVGLGFVIWMSGWVGTGGVASWSATV